MNGRNILLILYHSVCIIYTVNAFDTKYVYLIKILSRIV